MANTQTFMDFVKGRRSYHSLTDKSPISEERILELIKDTVLHTPSSFNSQTTRVVVLLKHEHKKFWECASCFSI
jgi:predicted oxidoreductase (fatty acid repression mutant protein)